MKAHVLTSKLTEAQLCILEGKKEEAKEIVSEVYYMIDESKPVPRLYDESSSIPG